MITIINYDNKHHAAFKSLNLEWLDKYNLTESHDLAILDDPEGTVLAGGGCIFLAIEGGSVIGTAGLWKENDKEYELIKMTVDPAWRGKGIGNLLLEKCIAEARIRGAEKIILFSNSRLTTALQLYEKYGFRHVEVTGAPFLTADVKMELIL